MLTNQYTQESRKLFISSERLTPRPLGQSAILLPYGSQSKMDLVAKSSLMFIIKSN